MDSKCPVTALSTLNTFKVKAVDINRCISGGPDTVCDRTASKIRSDTVVSLSERYSGLLSPTTYKLLHHCAPLTNILRCFLRVIYTSGTLISA